MTDLRTYDAAKDAHDCYYLGIEAQREYCVRAKQIRPEPDDPPHWLAEGVPLQPNGKPDWSRFDTKEPHRAVRK